MAHLRMPRGNATAWVSKPRHRSPPIRLGGYSFPRPDHGTKILRPGTRVEGSSHQSARQKGRSRPAKRSATGGCHHPPPSPPSVPQANIPQRSKSRPAKSKSSTWQALPRTNPTSKINQKNTLIRSDTTDPNDRITTIAAGHEVIQRTVILEPCLPSHAEC